MRACFAIGGYSGIGNSNALPFNTPLDTGRNIFGADLTICSVLTAGTLAASVLSDFVGLAAVEFAASGLLSVPFFAATLLAGVGSGLFG